MVREIGSGMGPGHLRHLSPDRVRVGTVVRILIGVNVMLVVRVRTGSWQGHGRIMAGLRLVMPRGQY